MLKRLVPVIFLFIFPSDFFGQQTDHEWGFQMNMANNPAFTGSEGDGTLRLSYLNFYPGNSYNLHYMHVSYDSYFPGLHGGAGVYFSDDYQGGIINDVRGGISYAYFLQAGRDLFINAGLSASVYHRGFNFNRAVLPDQIDPFGMVSLPSGEILASRGRSVIDIGAGFLFIYKNIFGGFSVNHLAQPDLSVSGPGENLKRKLTLQMTADIRPAGFQNLSIRPLTIMALQGSLFTVGAGAAAEMNFFTLTAVLLMDNTNNTNIQTGFSINPGKFSLFYNYRFNVVSGNKFMPFALLHQTGLVFSLNVVDKRNIIKTISFPKM